MSTNQELSEIFEQMGSALELLGANPFRVNSNMRVSRLLRDMSDDVGAIVEEDPATAEKRLQKISGIGKGTASRIVEYVQTGSVEEHRELLEKVPKGLFEVLDVPGIGPKAAKLMWDELGITSAAELQTMIDTDPDAIAGLPRMGKKKVEGIRAALDFAAKSADRIPIGQARPIALSIQRALRDAGGVRSAEYAGSLRRGRETIGDLDFLVACDDPEAVRELFCTFPGVTQVLARGDTKCSVRLEADGIAVQADLRIVPEEVYGAALMYFTGSKEHNVKLREIAIKKGMRLNEYGLFQGIDERPQDAGVTPAAAADEESIYGALGLPWIAPELREERVELEDVPDLVELGHIRSELHAHTVASDGKMSIEELAEEAKKRGFHTIAVTDHSQSQVIANGLDTDRLKRHVEAVREADAKVKGIKILAGSEVDILPDGSLDYEDDVLALLDVVVASPHAALGQDSAPATERLLAAIRHPLVHIIGHPTGRLLPKRRGLEPDMPALYAAAAEHDKALELNAHWRRLDLRDIHLRAALEAGCKVAIDTDAHRPEHFDNLVYGILTARRAGLKAASCVNTWDAKKLHGWLRSKR